MPVKIGKIGFLRAGFQTRLMKLLALSAVSPVSLGKTYELFIRLDRLRKISTTRSFIGTYRASPFLLRGMVSDSGLKVDV